MEKYVEKARKIEVFASLGNTTNDNKRFIDPESLETLIGADARILTLNMPQDKGENFFHAVQYNGITYVSVTEKSLAPKIYQCLKEME